MTLRRPHLWLLTSCLLLAAAPAHAQYPNFGVSNPYLAPQYPAQYPAQFPAQYPAQFPAQYPGGPPYANAAVWPTPPYQPAPGPWSPYAASAYQPQTPIAAPSPSDLPAAPPAPQPWSNPPPIGAEHGPIPLPSVEQGDPQPGIHAPSHHHHAPPSPPVPPYHQAPLDSHAAWGKSAQPWNQSAPCSTCGNVSCVGGCVGGLCGPNNGLYFQYDRVYWSISAPRVTDIGDAASQRFVTTPAGITLFYQNDLDTSFLDDDFATGDRFDFGYLNGCHGWAASVLRVRQRQGINAYGVSYVPLDPDGLMDGYSDSNGDSYDDDIDFDNFFGRHGEDLGTSDGAGGFIAPFDGIPDTPAPADTGDLVTYLVTFGALSAQNTTDMTGAELMNVNRTIGATGDDTWDWYCGVRYLQVRDRFLITASDGFLDAMSLDTNVRNNIVGPQVGGRWARRLGSLVLSAEGRFLLGFNFQRSEQSGSVATNASPGGQNAPVSLTAHSATRADTNEEFAPLGELRLGMAYKINRCAAFRFGYTALVTSGIGRASEQVIYRLPDFGLNTSGNTNQTLFCNALTFGLEFNR